MTSASTKRRLTSLGLVVAASVAAISAAARAQVSPNGAELQVNTYTTLQQLDARVAFNGQGCFLVVWASNGSTGSDPTFSIQAQRFASGGAPVGGQFQVNSYTTGNQRYPDVACSHMLVDAFAMDLLRRPQAYDVVLTENLFGDILSDEASMLAGALGMLPSASLGAGTAGLYEPIHGSAPDIAGKGVANPIGAILSAALLLRWSLNREDAAQAIEGAVSRVLAAGLRTADTVRDGETPVGTAAIADAIVNALP